MSQELSKSAKKVQEVLNRYGVELKVVQFSESTRSAQEASEAIGCELGQIAKSLVFKGKESQAPILVIASGANRVNEKTIKIYTKEKLEKADADYVLEQTGFAIGGIPPVGHRNRIATYIDEDLMKYTEIWAAAGTPHAVFSLTPDHLLQMTQGRVVAVK